MDIDTDRIDEAVLALLYLGLHDHRRAWKTFDWDTMNRLHEKGFISDPVRRAKSVVFTDAGFRESERLFAGIVRRPPLSVCRKRWDGARHQLRPHRNGTPIGRGRPVPNQELGPVILAPAGLGRTRATDAPP